MLRRVIKIENQIPRGQLLEEGNIYSEIDVSTGLTTVYRLEQNL
jgi:hypothetical protein